MAGLAAEQISDLITSTLKDLGRMRFTEIASTLQRYHALPHMLKEKKVKFQGGVGIRWNVLAEHSGAARHTALYDTDVVDVKDVLTFGSVPWRNTETSYAFDLREFDMNMGAAEIVDLVQVRRADSLISLAELMETAMWSKPTNSTDQKTPYGLQYWLVSAGSSSFKGFRTVNASGFSGGRGLIDSSVYTRWSNWADRYTSVTKTDLVEKMREGAEKTDFTSPIDTPNYDRGRPDMYYYMDYATKASLKNVAEKQNDQLGFDVDAAEGKLRFQGHPVSYVPKLDAATGSPILQIDWSVLHPVFLNNWYMKETKPYMAPGQHNVRRVHIDFTWNTRCHNLRRLAIFDTADWSAAA